MRMYLYNIRGGIIAYLVPACRFFYKIWICERILSKVIINMVKFMMRCAIYAAKGEVR